MTRLIRVASSSVAGVLLIMSTNVSRAARADAGPSGLAPTKVVTVTPAIGYSPTRIRVRLSRSEVDVISRMQTLARTWKSPYPTLDNHAVWRIEPAAERSPTLAVAVEAARAARAIFAVPHDDTTPPVVYIVARTQAYIREQIESIGCRPSSAVVNGAFLMGATVCNRNVVVINLTGYLFLRSATQSITGFMEARREPSFSATSYLVVDRNTSAIAHEWVHVARNRLGGGFVPDNEPAWFREGLAEVISGLARVRSSGTRYPYLHFHVIRLRKFFDWSTRCPLALHHYRSNGRIPTGCEYLKGGVAVELLLAKYGGLAKIYDLYGHMNETGDFSDAFRRTYGLSQSAFEMRADLYASYITQASAIPLP